MSCEVMDIWFHMDFIRMSLQVHRIILPGWMVQVLWVASPVTCLHKFTPPACLNPHPAPTVWRVADRQKFLNSIQRAQRAHLKMLWLIPIADCTAYGVSVLFVVVSWPFGGICVFYSYYPGYFTDAEAIVIYWWNRLLPNHCHARPLCTFLAIYCMQSCKLYSLLIGVASTKYMRL